MNFSNKLLSGLAICGLVLLSGCGQNSRRASKINKSKLKVKYHPNRPRRYKNGFLRAAVKASLIGGSIIAGGVVGTNLVLYGALLSSPLWAGSHGFCPCCLMGPALLGGAAGAVAGGVVAAKKSDSWTNMLIGRDKPATVQVEQLEQN